MHRKLPIAALLVSAVFAVPGCGGSVAVRSGFPAPVTPPPSGAHAGLSVSGGGELALAVVLGLIIVDSVYWAANRLHHATSQTSPDQALRPSVRRMDRGWVDRGP